MASGNCILLLWLIIQLSFSDEFLGLTKVGAVVEGGRGAQALFVFGDSYADTGNHNATDPSLASPWRIPYGITWPQHPSGRFSDGRVFTDFYASFLDVRKPVLYRLFNTTKKSNDKRSHDHRPRHRRGINFAFGGSGVFSTFGLQYPNTSVQIDQLRDLMQKGLVSKKLIRASMGLLVIAGNDYAEYAQKHPLYQGVTEFIPKVIEEMGLSLQALYDLGFRRIAATNLAPAGCLPSIAFLNNYTSCNLLVNQWGDLHNSLLASRISSLQAAHPKSHFLTLDLHSAFQTVITDGRFSLRPCCNGIGEGSCGDVDKYGQPLYTLCSSPSETLFWDRSHPTNAGWTAISKALFSL